MSINIAQFKDRISAESGFTSAEIISDSIIRALRTAGDSPYAVFYFDLAQDLPDSQENLTKYQDRVLGKQYFEGRKSLQWSNYLYFVTSKERLASGALQSSKELIERDRNYARKFVISEDEFESVIKPSSLAASSASPETSILSTWVELLAQEGLDEAILSDDDLPTRMELVEKSKKGAAKDRKLPKIISNIKKEPFISALELKTFRRFPVQRKYEFGSVNLFYGANGTGKTSLMEAIETFYCGKNKRNRNDNAPYELISLLADNRSESVTNARKPKIFRGRNLAWYGQAEVKTNDLCLSFAQFNFLDTDAAVSLAESTTRIEEDLSKLLVGPDASKVWHDIERVAEAVASKIRDLRPRENQYKEEISQLSLQLKQSGSIKQESDSIRIRLVAMMDRLKWNFGQIDIDSFASHVVETLSELESLLHEAATLIWTESPITTDGMKIYSTEAKSKIAKMETIIEEMDLTLKREKLSLLNGKTIQEALKFAVQAKNFINAGLPVRLAELSQLNTSLSNYANLLAGFDDNEIKDFSPLESDMNLGKYCETVTASRVAAETSLKEAKRKQADFTKLRDKSYGLAQQLREVASKILETNQKPDECPLCHTSFSPGELLKHINIDVEQHAEAIGQSLLGQLRELELALLAAVAKEAMSARFLKFRDYASIKFDVSVGSVLIDINKTETERTEIQNRIKLINTELLSLEAQAISIASWKQINDRLIELKYPLKVISLEEVDLLIASIQSELESSSNLLSEIKVKIQNLQKDAESIISVPDSNLRSIKDALSELKEKLTLTETICEKLLSFLTKIPWPGSRPIGELSIEVAAIRNVANELQTAAGKEKEAKSNFNDWTKRKVSVAASLLSLQSRIKRLNEVNATFDTIRTKHSLESAMELALRRNHAGIEAIFSKIHAPTDFRGLGLSLGTLIRKSDGSQAKLSQISTGQRAAFALSIFLAQNAQLTVAPPVILIDDPIAHVDDLNSLSFLDYLREVVLTGKRQIFFATANDKLAALFERKFDFLGTLGFRRFDFKRES
jgi:exonuclease SbcC